MRLRDAGVPQAVLQTMIAREQTNCRMAPKSLLRFFREHPASVGETYVEHFIHAMSFGWAMLRGSLACFAHGVFPWAHTRTGSQAVINLHDRMVINRRKLRADEMSTLDPLDSIAENI